MLTLLVGLSLFHGIHLIPTRPSLRNALVGRFGAGGYLGLFTLVSLVSLALIIIGYGEARGLVRSNPQLFVPPVWTRHVTYLLMLAATVLLVAAYVPSRIRNAARHPMLLAIKLWALGHLLVRGDLASLLLFGSFLAYAIYDVRSVKARGARGPLGDAPGGGRGDILVLALGLTAYGVMLLFGHSALIGVPLMRLSFAP